MDEFETAAKPLCDEIVNDNVTDAVTYYYGAWVKTKNNTYKDMFMGCCKLCQVLTKIDWLATLKIQIVTVSKFALLREESLMHQSEMNFIDTNYLTVKRDMIPACQSSTYHLIPVLLGNNVGFSSAFDTLSWESLLLQAIAPPRQNNTTYMGRYTSAIANKYKRNHCLNSFSLKRHSVCLVYVLSTKNYGYECCCYGDEIPFCQERIRNAIRTDSSVGLLRGKQIACIIDGDSVGDNWQVNFSPDGVEFKGDVHDLMNHMEHKVIELKCYVVYYRD
uniref:COesterase domain-containing protein n=1 Tax=Elaeophora elaphi TaxID=1147741 RepID=A0A0R3RJJ5_9BILA